MRLVLREVIPPTELSFLIVATLFDCYASFTFSTYVETRCYGVDNDDGAPTDIIHHIQVNADWLPILFIARACSKISTALIVLNWGCVDLLSVCPELRECIESTEYCRLTSKEVTRFAPRISARRAETELIQAVSCFLCFVFDTLVCWVTAFMCLQLEDESKALGGFLLCSILFFATLGFHLTNKCLAKMSKKGAIQVPTLHQHGLFYCAVTAPGSICSNCKSRFHAKIVREGSYKCTECSFLACKQCLKTTGESRAEGVEQLRRDDGLDRKLIFTSLLYFSKAIKLVKPVWHLYALSFIFVLARSICALGKTRFQMSVVTALYSRSEGEFWWYLRLSLTLTVRFPRSSRISL